MAGRRNTAASEKNLRPRAYEICLLQAEVQLEKARGRKASRTTKGERDVR
jgi:hypothetical protein